MMFALRAACPLLVLSALVFACETPQPNDQIRPLGQASSRRDKDKDKDKDKDSDEGTKPKPETTGDATQTTQPTQTDTQPTVPVETPATETPPVTTTTPPAADPPPATPPPANDPPPQQNLVLVGCCGPVGAAVCEVPQGSGCEAGTDATCQPDPANDPLCF